MASDVKMTDTRIRGLKVAEKDYYEWLGTGQRGTGRLGIRVYPSGQKIFVFRYFRQGKTVFIQLGKFPEMRLQQANAKANDLGALLVAGIDPKQQAEEQAIAAEIERRNAAMKGSIEELINAYTDKMKADGKRTYEDVKRRLAKDTYPVIPRETKAKDVTAEHIKIILANMIQRGSVVQSNRVRSYLHAAFQFGLKADNDPANVQGGVLFGLSLNPVSLVPKQAAAEKPGETWLKLDELRYFIEHFPATLGVGWNMPKLLELCVVLGGQRPYEVFSSEWSAVNWEEKTFLVTPEISKNKRPHIVPLTDRAFALLQELQQHNENNAAERKSRFIFPRRVAGKQKDDLPMRSDSLGQALGYWREANPDFTYFVPRDLRRTVKTLMGELGISKEIRDRIQNHALNDVSSKHYDRYSYLPEKRNALELWEARLYQADAVGNVVNMR